MVYAFFVGERDGGVGYPEDLGGSAAERSRGVGPRWFRL